ncbi:hypothetical protein AKJ09_03687 [Labilithrix luteola]|uniref:Uncharacterized protein n=1 Tax=Labilithrix luteola TaxID=1391654 RepID=A0A0K1PU05_9BACT|nr:hypothetical protein AKJ09_03687 [Labilithrix luteola]
MTALSQAAIVRDHQNANLPLWFRCLRGDRPRSMGTMTMIVTVGR